MTNVWVKLVLCLLVITFVFTGCGKVDPTAGSGTTSEAKEGSGFQYAKMKIRFFCGGDEGDAFASIVVKGAMDAAEMLKPYGVTVDYVFSGWSPEKLSAQLRDAIAAKVDAICFLAVAGEEALKSLAEEAHKAGIIMMYWNTDVPNLRKLYGSGLAGVPDLTAQGRTLGEAAVTQLGLKRGDRAVVFGAFDQPGRYFREEGTALAFEAAGMTVERIVTPQGASSEPQMLIPIITGQLQSHPETKIISYAGGQNLSAAEVYMTAAGKKPGEVYNIGFDTTPAIIDGFNKGYIQLSSDQQPYLQGFLPVMNCFLTKNFALSGLLIETGAGLITKDNCRVVESLVNGGYR
jgi:simple sugar transport system substrate-binding protein